MASEAILEVMQLLTGTKNHVAVRIIRLKTGLRQYAFSFRQAYGQPQSERLVTALPELDHYQPISG